MALPWLLKRLKPKKKPQALLTEDSIVSQAADEELDHFTPYGQRH